MTDYYTHFCFSVKVTQNQVSWIKDEIRKRSEQSREDALYLGCDYDYFEATDEVVFTDRDGQDNVDAVIDLLCAFQRKFKLKTFISFEWAFTASQPRIGAYGGGAVVLRYGIPSYMNTYEWIQKKIRRRT